MSLTNRFSLFFLAALAVVLAGFSVTLYALFSVHLYAQLDERLETAMQALVAAVEVHSEDVEWEPLERRIVIGEDPVGDQPRWTLHDLSGRLRDRSLNLDPQNESAEVGGGGWRVLIRRMRTGHFAAEVVDGNDGPTVATSLSAALGERATIELPDDRTFRSDGLLLTVAVSEAPVTAMLHWLALVVAAVSVSIWITAALWGRWLCQRALQPISAMAKSARTIRREIEPAKPLDVPATRDELQDLGQAFNDLLAALHESLERQRRFTGDASHQLRTPLTAMLTSVDVALRQERTPAEYQHVLEIVNRRGKQLRQIIESLLFLARADGASSLGEPETVDVNDWCQAWLETWTEHDRAGDFRFESAPTRALTTTYPALLGQVLDNLLDNACKYSEAGSPILVNVAVSPGAVNLIVSDFGWGIAADQQSLIFEPFYRTNEARWHGKVGAGLGLGVVQRLAKILGAKIELTSEIGKGSSFKVILPAAVAPQESVPAEAAQTH